MIGKDSKYDVVIVGAGVSGLFMFHKLRNMGLSVLVIEKSDELGGTWNWNRYPGARCDIPSLEYSYQFDEDLQQEWNWSEKYSAGPEILEYLNHVADRFDLKKDINFEEEVVEAKFNEANSQWSIKTSKQEYQTKFCIFATGCLSVPNKPEIEGLESFEGELLHTATWPRDEVDFTGKNVAIIGTGSSSIQTIPEIAKDVNNLYVFQRTPNYSIPSNNGPMDTETEAKVKERYAEFRKENYLNGFGIASDSGEALISESDLEEVNSQLEENWKKSGLGFFGGYGDIPVDVDANEVAANFVRNKIKETVNDPETAKKLCPEYHIGGKRLCVDTGYFETFNRDNVHLIDLHATPIEKVHSNAIEADETYEIDTLILATGFDAMTGALTSLDILGRNEINLRDQWKEGAKSYLGLGVRNFPNLFTITGPGSPSVLSNMMPSIEQHVNWIADCIGWMLENDKSVIESTKIAEDEWMELVNEIADMTIFTSTKSWYNGSNIEDKAKAFLPFIGVPVYTEKLEEITADDYQGFIFDKSN
jgi:cation diffusion facilitator CzcD-associated flavoprotein CzcO